MKRAENPKWQFRKTLEKEGYGVVNVPAQISYCHERTVVAGRDWICVECGKAILRGHPYVRTSIGDSKRQQQFHTCWECVKRGGYEVGLPYTKYGETAAVDDVASTFKTPPLTEPITRG